MVPNAILFLAVALFYSSIVSSASPIEDCPKENLATRYPNENDCTRSVRSIASFFQNKINLNLTMKTNLLYSTLYSFFVCLNGQRVLSRCPFGMTFNVDALKCEPADSSSVSCLQLFLPTLENHAISGNNEGSGNSPIDDDASNYEQPLQLKLGPLIPTVIPGGPWESNPGVSSAAQVLVKIILVICGICFVALL